MPVDVNEGALTISGRFGEAFYIDPSGVRPPLTIAEATQGTFTKSIAVEDVMLSGNRTGSKDGAETPGTGVLVLRKIDMFFQNIVYEQLSLGTNLPARRAARDAGVRIARTFTLQVWEDDPEALGAIGHQLEGVRLSDYEGGFDFGQTQTSVSFNFRFENVRQLRSFERIGNQVDPASGLPAIRYTVDDRA